MTTPFSPHNTPITAPGLTLLPIDRAGARSILIAVPPDDHIWGPEYPTDGSLACAAAVITADDEGRTDPFGAFWIRRDLDATIVGDVIFHGPPDERGIIDIGYGLIPAARGAGLATRAVITMIEWAFTDPTVTRVTANTTDDNLGSIGVMHRVGMNVTHGPGGLMRGVALRGFWRAPDDVDLNAGPVSH
jgi:RimJ/RimL family protein N-acetyltransferase